PGPRTFASNRGSLCNGEGLAGAQTEGREWVGNREETLVADRHTQQGRRMAADDMAAALAYMVEEPPAPAISQGGRTRRRWTGAGCSPWLRRSSCPPPIMPTGRNIPAISLPASLPSLHEPHQSDQRKRLSWKEMRHRSGCPCCFAYRFPVYSFSHAEAAKD